MSKCFCPNTLLKSQSSKLKVFCVCVGTHARHGTRFTGLKKLFMSPSIVLAQLLAIQMASNCWLLALNVAVAHELLHIVRKVCCFERAVECESVCTSFALANLAMSAL